MSIPSDVPAGVGLCAYRTVQEGLINAMCHADGSPIDLAVTSDPRTLRVRVRSRGRTGAGAALGTGTGLIGQRERASLCGGRMAAAPDASGYLLDVPDIEVVGEAADGISGVKESLRTLPDLVLVDVRMPRMDGVDATTHIVHDHPDSRVLILTTFDLGEAVHRALQAGASGFLLKDTPDDQLLHAIRVVAGDCVLAPSVTRRLIEHFTPQPTPTASDAALLDRLSDREREVLRLVAQGMSNAEIGPAIFLS